MATVAQLTIAIDDAGRVSVNGPIENTMFCYGLLEVAKDTIRNHALERQRTVQPPAAADVVAFGARRT